MKDYEVKDEGEFYRLALDGKLYGQDNKEIKKKIEHFYKSIQDKKDLIVDLEGINSFNSTGIGGLIVLKKLLGENNTGFGIMNLSETLEHAFAHLQLEQFINIYDSIEEVKSYYRKTNKI